MNDHLSRFQALLSEIFQFDFADLDTGIYRLFRLREKELRRFIDETLPAEVDAAFGADTSGQRQQVQEKVDELADKIRDELADDAVLPNGDLAAEYKKTKLGKQYLAAHKAMNEISANESDRDEVFNHLYTFFSRYYEDADFIPKRRYSRRPDTYAVPYSGEEVMFHWATRGMHYIKTGEHFRDYRFRQDTLEGACTVHFRLTEADIPKDNTKGDRRWFFPLPRSIEWDEATRTLILPFHYRLPTEKEAELHGKNSKAQRSVLAATEKKILDKVAKDAPFLQPKLAEATEDGEDSYLLRRMGHFARRHSADYFIYPELKAFLTRELEFYVKDQMLHLDDLEGALDARLRLIRVVSVIAEKIIEFLDAIEQLQNRLFEKPKFVLSTDWLLHIRHVPEKLWSEIIKNKAQKAAWRQLFSTPAKVDKRFLKTHPTLVLDTRHFDADFKRRLLEQLPFENIEEATDGLLIHSENWQALNLLQHKYAGKVKCIYIDPPYNTGSDEFIYKDRYQHASWMSMMAERLRQASGLLKDSGIFLSSISDIEITNLRKLLDYEFNSSNLLAAFIWVNEGNIDNQSKFKLNHDYVLAYAKEESKIIPPPVIDPNIDETSKLFKEAVENTIVKNGPKNPVSEIRLPKGFPANFEQGVIKKDKSGWPKYNCDADISDGKLANEVVVSSGWSSKELFEEFIKNNFLPVVDLKGQESVFYITDTGAIYVKKVRSELQSHVLTVLKSMGGVQSMSAKLKDIGIDFKYPKPTQLVDYLTNVGSTGEDGCFVLDYFAGSGSTSDAIISQNRRINKNRKFILVEVGRHFHTAIEPLVEKNLYSPTWEKNKPIVEPVFDDLLADTALPDWVERSPRLVKVLQLESYEDSLQNLISREEIKPGNDGQETSLHYLFERAGESAATLLNVEQLEHPFDYQLDVLGEDGPQTQPIDLVETANLLLGLEVVKYETWAAPDKRDYLAVHAQKEGRSWLVLWRDMADLDIEAERKYLEPKIKGFDEVRINGDSAVPGIRSIDLDLARAMGAA